MAGPFNDSNFQQAAPPTPPPPSVDPAMVATAKKLIGAVEMAKVHAPGARATRFDKNGLEQLVVMCAPAFVQAHPDATPDDGNGAFGCAIREIIADVFPG